MKILNVPMPEVDWKKLEAQANERRLQMEDLAEVYLSEKINEVHFRRKTVAPNQG